MVKNQRTKKATAGDKVAGDIWGTDFNSGVNFSRGEKIAAAARRIDRAIAAAYRRGFKDGVDQQRQKVRDA